MRICPIIYKFLRTPGRINIPYQNSDGPIVQIHLLLLSVNNDVLSPELVDVVQGG